jgi:predicted transcriptional regulator
MNVTDLFTGTKWDILSNLSKQKQSPLELANKLNTTIANISQQLRLLEAAGLVKTEKTRSAEKGKPRILYSLAKDFVYVVTLQDGVAEKKLIEANRLHNIISMIWQLKNSEIHDEVIKLVCEVEKELSEIDLIGFDEITKTVYISGKKIPVKSKLDLKFVNSSHILKNKEIFIIYKKGGLNE